MNLLKMQISTGAAQLVIILAYQLVWRLSEFAFLVRFTSVAALFYMLIGGYMSNNIPEKVIDITGIELTPGHLADCLGNGEREMECCCDECDYYLFCFPEFDPKSDKENKA